LHRHDWPIGRYSSSQRLAEVDHFFAGTFAS